jgi:hypothetical protein
LDSTFCSIFFYEDKIPEGGITKLLTGDTFSPLEAFSFFGEGNEARLLEASFYPTNQRKEIWETIARLIPEGRREDL